MNCFHHNIDVTLFVFNLFYSEFSKSLNSAELEPSFSETLTTSLSEQSVTQSVGTATVVTIVTSSEDDLNGQKRYHIIFFCLNFVLITD